ncbi:hypothetical protein Y032_0227g2799 [Ancylostoma ceylanicum]|nr:hypothetical protein Y032_0227g2799 [Ancylostoma ceylanicum]
MIILRVVPQQQQLLLRRKYYPSKKIANQNTHGLSCVKVRSRSTSMARRPLSAQELNAPTCSRTLFAENGGGRPGTADGGDAVAALQDTPTAAARDRRHAADSVQSTNGRQPSSKRSARLASGEIVPGLLVTRAPCVRTNAASVSTKNDEDSRTPGEKKYCLQMRKKPLITLMRIVLGQS